tara:strand:+ start:1309 stop:1599 length:291 start_codon:yes stop_codon:yes gene_type:complete
MLWFIYIIFSILACLILSNFFKRNYSFFFIFLVILITPTQINLLQQDLSPSLFTFIFNLVLERDFSLRPLKPLFLSLPVSLFFIIVASGIKKRFFQ